MEPEVIRTREFVSDAANRVVSRLLAAQTDGGIFRLSLCGGSTPAAVYRALAEHPGIDWQRVLLTFGDERTVPPDDPQSNYRMVKEALLDPAGVPATSVLRLSGELPPDEAASRAEGQLRKLASLAGETVFRHDLVLLGMGDDGHTASLFPGTAALEETERWVVANCVPQLDTERITFTYPLIAGADEVLFLVNGKAKHAMAERVLSGDPAYPASSVRARKVTWLIGE